jgi:hypothetical protein
MKIRTLTATALVGIVGMFGAASANAAGDTKVTIKGDNGDYYGYVKSSDPACESFDREVKVYEMLGSKPKPKNDQLIGSDTAQPNGPDLMWSIGNSGYKDGSFYAKVKKANGCDADLSKVIVR